MTYPQMSATILTLWHTSRINRIKYILLATHFYPPVGLTIWAVTYAYVLNPHFNLAPLTVMILLGQFALGWSNDYIDRHRDASINRTEKPIVAGHVSANLIKWLAVASFLMSASISFTYGLLPSILYIAALASGFLYNLILKQTAFSIVAYFVSFSLLPVVISLITQESIASLTTIIVFGLIGSAMYFQDVIPDMQDDATTNVKGFAHRFSHLHALMLCTLLAILATALALTSLHNIITKLIIITLIICISGLFIRSLRKQRLGQSHSISLAITLVAIIASLASAT